MSAVVTQLTVTFWPIVIVDDRNHAIDEIKKLPGIRTNIRKKCISPLVGSKIGSDETLRCQSISENTMGVFDFSTLDETVSSTTKSFYHVLLRKSTSHSGSIIWNINRRDRSAFASFASLLRGLWSRFGRCRLVDFVPDGLILRRS